jgi:amino-acid N-acetyltransferase
MNTRSRITLRSGRASDVRRLHALIAAHREEGHLLPRSVEDIRARATRFVVAIQGRRIVGCAELAPLSGQVAEVRSLAVDGAARSHGVGASVVGELRERARREGFDQLCAFTHAPAYFSRMGFSIVPHLWLGEKVFTDCVKCPQFRQCGQYAMMLPLHRSQPADEGGTGMPLHLSSPALGGGSHSAIALRLA